MDQWTTVVLRQIPFTYNEEKMLEIFENHGFGADYLFLPRLGWGGKTVNNRGFCFANFNTHEEACNFIKFFDGFALDPKNQKRAIVGWATRQGFEANLEYSRATDVVHRIQPFINHDDHLEL
jgi:RNA recognition motif-containing protein